MTNLQDVIDKDFPWPRRGDVAFKSGEQGTAAPIAATSHGRLRMMTAGYKLAADCLIKRVVESPDERIFLIYPIAFNYRHFVELKLKSLISAYGSGVGVSARWDTHDLNELWETYKTIDDRFGVPDPYGCTDAAAALIREFAKIDPGSFSFRYPFDKKGKLIPIGIENVDLQQLAWCLDSLDYFLDQTDECWGWFRDNSEARAHLSNQEDNDEKPDYIFG